MKTMLLKSIEVIDKSDNVTLVPNLRMLAGIGVGIIIGVGILALVAYSRRNEGGLFSKYDERQKVAQGLAYRNGFWTVVVLLCGWYILDLCDLWLPTGRNLTILLIMLTGVLVYVVSCIMMDAYIGLNDNRKRTAISLSVLTVSNLGLGFANRAAGSSTFVMNLLVGCMTLVVLAAIGIKTLLERRNGGEEE